MGFVVKLLAVAEQTEAGEVGVRVHPAMVPVEHLLAAVRESFNAIFVEGAAVGDLMFWAGRRRSPTASAILGDLVDAAINRHKGSHASVGPARGQCRDRSTMPSRRTTSTSRCSTARACSPRSPACSATTACRSARWSRRGWGTRPA